MTQIDPDKQTNGSTVALNSKTKDKNRKGCCKRITKFLFSHIGLVGMVIIYAVLGGFLFELLERHEEMRLCEIGKGEEDTNIVTLRAKLLTYIQFNITTNPLELDKDNETVANENIESWLREFRNQTLDLKSTYGYTGSDCSEPRWTFPGALLFAVTVFTTIGYGHLTPVTWEGQIVCVCYATIGIPIFLMCLSNLSGVLGDMFRFVYSRICCRPCYNKKKNPSVDPQNGFDQDAVTARTSVSPAWNVTEETNGKTNNKGARVVDDPEDFDKPKFDEDDEEEKVTVPLTVTMIVITAYLLIGAVLFHTFEGWSMIQAGYFCYITLATIGFGDFVPGQTPGDQYATVKLVLGSIYVLFGMSILGMCFDLMQEEIIAKFTWLGKKIGIIDEEQPEEYDENGAADGYADDDEDKKEDKFNNIDRQSRAETRSNSNNGTSKNGYYSSSDQQKRELTAQFRTGYLENVIQRQQYKS